MWFSHTYTYRYSTHAVLSLSADFQKAFNRVDHYVLLSILSKFGHSTSLLDLLENNLCDFIQVNSLNLKERRKAVTWVHYYF